VYGPLDANAQQAFLNELAALRSSLLGPWLLCGDFNMIYRTADKNNDRLDRRCMRRFGRFLGAVVVEELHLNGHLFTWTNKRLHLTLERIDRTFASVDWLDLYPNHQL
jgi:endonuclease/exonuclease/phosphatase family metal-dependent hydrolase